MYDYHVHSALCRHATGAAADYVLAARTTGVAELGFTDHAPAPDGYDPGNRMVMEQFPRYRDEVAAAAAAAPEPVVLFGVEADYYPAGVGFLRDWLPAQKFDLVLGAVHYIGGWGFDNPTALRAWESVDVTGAWREYFRLLGELAATRLFDVVAHLDLPKKFGHRPKDREVIEMAQPVLDRIAAAGMGLEISTSGLRKAVKEIYPSPFLLALARERQIPICFGSDAHRPEDVAFAFDQALALARAAGYTQMLQCRQREKQLVPLDAPAKA
jgi:histidinol-phosphatase (PHP family)